MSGGMSKRAISKALSAPPAQPASERNRRGRGQRQCQSLIRGTEDNRRQPHHRPDRQSMPPLMMTGVNAIASSPSSTLRRVISNKLPSVKKFCAIAANSATSAPSASSRIHSPPDNVRGR